METSINIYLHVKFRAFKITLGTVKLKGELRVGMSAAGSPIFKWREHNDEINPNYKTLFNDRGVQLLVW